MMSPSNGVVGMKGNVNMDGTIEIVGLDGEFAEIRGMLKQILDRMDAEDSQRAEEPEVVSVETSVSTPQVEDDVEVEEDVEEEVVYYQTSLVRYYDAILDVLLSAMTIKGKDAGVRWWSIRMVAEIIGKSSGHTSQVLRQMLSDKLISKRPQPRNGRIGRMVYMYYVSPENREVIEMYRANKSAWTTSRRMKLLAKYQGMDVGE